jgi:hypothetical protein
MPPLFQEALSQVRLWFDKLTMRGLRHVKNQLLAVHPELVEGRMANSERGSK